MKDKLRELAERWKNRDYDDMEHLQWYAMGIRQARDELLEILDAEGDGGAVPDDDLPGMWSNADFTGGDPDERCHAARVSGDEQFNAFRLAYYGANKSLAPNLEIFRRAYQTITNPARSGVVSDEDVRDAERYRWLRDNVQPFRNGNPSPHAIVKVSLGIGADQRERSFDLIDKEAHVGVVTLDQAIDAAIQGERHER